VTNTIKAVFVLFQLKYKTSITEATRFLLLKTKKYWYS